MPRVPLVSLVFVLVGACASTPPPPPAFELRHPDRAVVAFAKADPADPYFLDERLAPWPSVEGDRDLGPRRLLRTRGLAEPEVVYEPGPDERMTDAVVHPSGEWTAVGVDAERVVFVVRGGADGRVLSRTRLEDPGLFDDPRAYLDGARPARLETSALSEDGVRVAALGEDAIVAIVSSANAVVAYRLHHGDSGWAVGSRTLVSPAAYLTPFLPIGGSYDDFDAMVIWFHVFVATDSHGHAFVGHWTSASRLAQHDAAMGTTHEILRTDSDRTNRPSDVLVSRLDRSGEVAWSTVVGIPDLDDEPYGLAASDDTVAVVGRTRRYRGLDNTEWDAFVALVDHEGTRGAATLFDARDSGMAQAAVFTPERSLLVGGTEGFAQNPEGFSLYQPGEPLLLELRDGVLARVDGVLPATTPHAELRALAATRDAVLVGGLERGPLTHTGDADRSLVRADGFLAASARR